MITCSIFDRNQWPFAKPKKQPLWVSVLGVPVFIIGFSAIVGMQFWDWLKK